MKISGAHMAVSSKHLTWCLPLACDVIQSLIVNINTDQVALCTDLIGVAVNVTEGCGKLSKIDVTAVLIFKYSPK